MLIDAESTSELAFNLPARPQVNSLTKHLFTQNVKLPKLKIVFKAIFALFAVFYVLGAIVYSQRDIEPVAAFDQPNEPLKIAIFGASGTAGDGILKAAMASDDIGSIHVVTRRETPRMTEGAKSGKVRIVKHMDYLDYSAIIDQFKDVDAVFWAIGISAIGTDEQTYGLIHTDFPSAFVSAWNRVSEVPNRSFHFISSSDISEDSTTMWIREKIRSEKTLFGLAEGSDLRVIAFRPDYIGPTEEEAHLGQKMLYWFFRPVGAAVKSKEIGEAMIAATLSSKQFENGAKLPTPEIVRYATAYQNR